MGYFYLILQALIFSFGGLLIKSVGTMFSPFLTSCLRFTIGIAMLFLIQRIRTGRIRLTLTDRVILIGGVCKALHYLAENFGVMRGFSYGGVLVWPVQTIVVFLVSTLVYKERTGLRTLAGTILCVAGVITISWNGASLSVFLGSSGIIMAAFVLAGIGAAGFSISQKARIREMDIVEMNASMFTFGWLTTLLVLIPTAPHATGAVNISGTISMLLLGIITCVGFLLQAAGIRTVPLLIATIIQSSSTVLTILWGVLFYHDPISRYVVLGTVFFMTGIVLVNLPAMKSRHLQQTDE